MAHSQSAFKVDESQILSSVNEQLESSLKRSCNVTSSSWIEGMPDLPDVVNGGFFISKVPEKVSVESSNVYFCCACLRERVIERKRA